MQKTTIFKVVCFRVVVALLTRTFFQPDEYFQSLEPAHVAVFGYGHLTWEWLTDQPVRSMIYPALNIPVYWLLKVTGLHYEWPPLLIAGPKILHGALAAITDLWVCELAVQVLGPRYVETTLLLSLTSFFHFLSLSRSLSNSLETSLTTIALCYYPWPYTANFGLARLRLCLFWAAMACVVRPTNAVIWVYMIGTHVWRLSFRTGLLMIIAINVLAIGNVTLGILTAVDSIYYSKLTLTPLNFVRTNLSSVSLFYGSSPWHYYITQGLPILCTTSLPFVLDGIWKIWSDRRPTPATQNIKTLLVCVGWTVGIYSMAGHKEWRFLHPLLPVLHVFAAKSLVDSYSNQAVPAYKYEQFGKEESKPTTTIKRSILWLLLATAPASLYVMFFHCSSQIGVTTYLRGIPSSESRTIGFLMPCHSTPWQAYLHRSDLAEYGRLWALGCEPPLGVKNATAYKDQTDIFYDAPDAYLQTNFPSKVDVSFPPSPFPASSPGTVIDVKEGSTGPWKHEWPELLVMFGVLLENWNVKSQLEAQGYEEVKSIGWKWEGEGKRRGGVKVWKYLR